MPVDANIAMEVRPIELENPLNNFAKVMAIQNAQNQNALSQYQLSSAQRGDAEANALNKAYQESYDPTTGNLDFNKVVGRAAQYGAGSKIPALVKTQHEADKAKWESIAAQDKVISERAEQSRRGLEGVRADDPNVGNILMQWNAQNFQDPILKTYFAQRGITPEQSNERIKDALANGPAAIQSFLDESKMGAAKVADLHKGVSVAAGARLADPVTGKIIATSEPEKAALVKEYESARLPENGGYKGTFTDYVTMKANAGASKVSMNVKGYMPASEEAQKRFMDASAENYKVLRNTPVDIANLEAAKKLVPGAKGFMGPGGETLLNAASFLNDRLGAKIDLKGVTDANEIRTRMAQGVFDSLKKIDSNPTERQQAILSQAMGNLGTDPNAMTRIIDVAIEMKRDRVALHNAEVQSAEKRGVVLPFDAKIKLPDPVVSNTVTTPDGKTHTFPTPEAAEQFKKAARL